MDKMKPQTDREFLIQIHSTVTQIQGDMTELKEKVAEKPDKDFCKDQHNTINNRLLDHSKRLRSLENWRYYIVGGIAGIYIILRAVWDYLQG